MKWFGSSEKKESENYEKKYLARYKKQQKPKQKKNTSKNKKDVKIFLLFGFNHSKKILSGFCFSV